MSNPTRMAWASAGVVFAGCTMLTVGLFQVFQGIAAIATDELYVDSPNYTFAIDTTGWGWIHLILGALVAIVGVFVLFSNPWAYLVGIILAVISAVNQFFFLPYYPWWAILVIALDFFVIWALAVVLSETRVDV